METIVIKVANESKVNSMAGMIAASIREGKKVEAQAIGAGAVNQAVKAVIVARGYLAPLGIDLNCTPAFVSVDVENETRTGIKLILNTK